jgi:hypothetical protein
MFTNPLEQFEIFPVFQLGNVVFITNSSLFLIFSLFLVIFLYQVTTVNGGGSIIFNR